MLIIQIFFWIIFFFRLLFWKSNTQQHNKAQISNIICTKNDIKNLQLCLQNLLTQKPALSEIIIVDDFSIDDTKSEVESLHELNNNIIYVKSANDHPGKKIALDTGIRKAKSPFVILTDADCIPPVTWVKTMGAELVGNVKIVLGHAPFYKTTTWVNRWSRFENFISAIQYLSYSLWKMPYMGVGRNLLYSRNLYLDSFSKINLQLDTASGDDDIFINQVASASNTAICLHPESFVYSDAKGSWKEYVQQKKRHYSSATYYKTIHKFMLSLFSLSHILFYLLFFTLSLSSNWEFALFVFLIRMILLSFSFYKLSQIFKETDLLKFFPILDLMLFFHYIYFSFFVLFPSKKTW